MTSRFHSSVAVLAITESRISCTWILGAFAARKNKWSLLADIIYLDIALEWDIDSARVVDEINFSGPTLGIIFRS